jgi:hypothetical protein
VTATVGASAGKVDTRVSPPDQRGPAVADTM